MLLALLAAAAFALSAALTVGAPASASTAAEDVQASTTGTGILTGTVTDQFGQPLSEAFVWLTSPAQDDFMEFATTDAQGNYRIQGLESGQYMLDAWSADHYCELPGEAMTFSESREVAFSATGEQREDFSLLLADQVLSGTVRSEAGDPVAGYSVEVNGFSATSDAQGSFSACVLSGSELFIWGGTQGDSDTERYYLRPLILEAQETPLELTVREMGRIEGTVTFNGEPVSGVYVDTWTVDANSEDYWYEWDSTGDDGTYTFYLPAGEYIVSADGYVGGDWVYTSYGTDAANPQGAPVPVAWGEVVSGVDFELGAAPSDDGSGTGPQSPAGSRPTPNMEMPASPATPVSSRESAHPAGSVPAPLSRSSSEPSAPLPSLPAEESPAAMRVATPAQEQETPAAVAGPSSTVTPESGALAVTGTTMSALAMGALALLGAGVLLLMRGRRAGESCED
ncbi:hypothetical protein GCM10009771_13740 [Nesterenkonia flava]